MRRVTSMALVALLMAPACATGDRAEGIVERWLVALNQGSAGRPERYAATRLSEQVLPRFDEREPGELDVIEVGRGTAGCGVAGWFVPFRVIRTDGSSLRSVACTDKGRVAELFPHTAEHVPRELDLLPSEGGPPIAGEDPAGWVAAAGASLALAALAELAMRIARRGASPRLGPRTLG